MDTAIAQPTPAVLPQRIAPNQFELRNRRISVSFSATSITGDPLLHYKDRLREVDARGKEIRQVETEIGTLVSVTLEPDADAGALIFTLLIPRVILASTTSEQPIVTQALLTRSRFPRLPTSAQLQTYEAVELKGRATFVVS
ncbi:MAG: hypothetical protein JXB05_15120 [Myxococcaceae bacterium]|nr:hypothetical protein [Myxococcaceae bacterium]